MRIPKIKAENFSKRFFVILADRQKYRFFTIYLGDFQQSEELLREDVPKSIRHDLGDMVKQVGI